MKTVEYREGPEAKENFDNAMQALFQTPKPTIRKQKQKPATTRKTKSSDKN